MRFIKKVALAGIFLFMIAKVEAQTNKALMGKWEATYEEEGEEVTVTYEFVNENEKLICNTIYIRNDKNNSGEYNSLAMKNIKFKNGFGRALYVYKEDNETYEMKAQLELIDSKTLKIDYSYWGYTGQEIWKKVIK